MRQKQPLTQILRLCMVGILGIILAGSLTSCGSSASPQSTQTTVAAPAPTPAPLQKEDISGSGGNLIMTLGYQDPPTLDPALVGDTTSAFVTSQLFSGLVQLDNNLDVQPDLAARWEISDDGTTYTFFLRQDAAFADGTPLTTKDVRFSLERATDPNLGPYLPAQTYLGDIVGVREKLAGTASNIAGINVIDPHTIQLTIDSPRSYFLSKLVHPTAFVVHRDTVEEGGIEWTENPNGSGPFDIETWNHNRQMVLKRNVNYYGDLALLDRVTFLMGASASNPLILYEQGKIDVTYVNSFALARVRDTSNPLSRELVSVPQLSITYIGMNVTKPPFDDRRVRQAFALLLDREKYAEVTQHDSVEPAYGILPPGMPGYNPDLPKRLEDIERARQLLEESRYGGANGLPPIVAYGGGSVHILREVLEEEMDLSMEVRSFENFSEYLQAMKAADLPMYSTGWIADYPDPENFLNVLFHSESLENHAAYSNQDVDRLLEQAAQEQDNTERWELYQKAEQLILDDAPIIPVYHDVDHLLIKPYVKGLELTPMGIQDLSTVELVR